MRIIGLDYGSRTVGVAVSDPLGITAQAVETITRKDENKLRRTCARIEELIREYQAERIVLGLPKHMNNDIGERAEKSLEFQKMLEKRTGLHVVMWDERLTTVEADRTMMETGIRRENRKEYVDMLAAVFILQGYLDYLAGARSYRNSPLKIASRWAGCPQVLRFYTVCAVNAQTWMNCNSRLLYRIIEGILYGKNYIYSR